MQVSKIIKQTRFWLAAGLLLIGAGFVYDLIFAGLPYQDPSPEVLARWEFHARVAGAIRSVGYTLMFLAILRAILRKARDLWNSEPPGLESEI